MEHYLPLSRIRFPEEMFDVGEPDLRPARGRGVISRTAGMAALEADFTNRVLLGTVQGTRPPVSPEELVQALGQVCEVPRERVRVEITYPADFFITFASAEDCARVLELSGHFRCGRALLGFRRWHRTPRRLGKNLSSSPSSASKVCLPACAWEWEAISQLVNHLGGQLVEILPSSDRWCLKLMAWLRSPSTVPKEYELEVPEPAGLPNAPAFSVDPASPPPPMPPTCRRTLVHPLIIHVLEVVDRTPVVTDYPLDSVDKDEDTTRRHIHSWWGGRVDGTGRGPARGGGHVYADAGTVEHASDGGQR
jgi:hypothetical protein